MSGRQSNTNASKEAGKKKATNASKEAGKKKATNASKEAGKKKDKKSKSKETETREKDEGHGSNNDVNESGEGLPTSDEGITSNEDITDSPPPQPRNVAINYVAMVCIIVAFLATVSLVLPHPKNTLVHNDIQTGLKKLFEDFKNQSERSTRKLRSRILPYLDRKTSPQPFVLMVVAMPEDRHTAYCFAARVGKLINSEPVVINGSQYSDVESNETKLQIDEKLQNAFRRDAFPTVAIIHNLEALPYSTSDLFYKYCDHDNPRYKETAIIFTVILPQNYDSILSTSDEITKEGVVEQYLSTDSQWAKDEKFDENIMGALLSRISDTVIVMRSESQESLENFC